jgi:antitoxin ParD1/3/4
MAAIGHWQRLPVVLKLRKWNKRGCVMPTRNVNLTEELDRFVHKKVRSGRYENASEVVRAALRSLEREEQQHDAKIVALRAAIDEGEASGIADGDVFARVRGKLKLPRSPR